MRRVYLPGELGEVVSIAGADAHHLMHSMRAKAGQELIVVDASGQVGRVELVSFTAETVTARLLERVEDDAESPLWVELAQCLPKGDKMELIVQKAVELGVRKIYPIQSETSVVRYDSARAEKRRQRWQRIADEASGQCGRSQRPSVEPVQSLDAWLEGLSLEAGELFIFCYEGEEQQGLKACLSAGEIERVLLLVGPEGGFSSGEAKRIRAAGAKSIRLGSRILRTETAAIAAMSAVQYELGDLGKAVPKEEGGPC